MANNSLLGVKVLPPNYKWNLVYEGRAKSVSGQNSEGNFDVLPMHENFVTTVYDRLIIVEDNGQVREIKVGKGFLEVSGNEVKIFVDF